MPPDPIIIHYTVNPTIAPPEKPSAWDVEVKTEDSLLKGRMNAMLQASKESAATFMKLDEEVRQRPHLKF